jgi:6-pyruvoyltetrahydropterin/6-carboxytetrahydropterin synthase
MQRLTTIELFKEYLNFSAAHFTVFSATERERLHGHNFSVYAAITAPVTDNGMTADYGLFKNKLKKLCEDLDEYTLIAGDSPHLTIERQEGEVLVHFAKDMLRFPETDCIVLPIRNTTVEEFSHYLLQKLVADVDIVEDYFVTSIVVKVSSGAGQYGSAEWRRDS